MATRIGINGFGRVGRLTLRAVNQYHDSQLEVVAINDLTDTKTNAHLLKWDSTYGPYPGKVQATEDSIIVDGKQIKVLSEREPGNTGYLPMLPKLKPTFRTASRRCSFQLRRRMKT
jgi:glyceraldehyde 3-phosphate dehydrogenase